MSSPPSSAVSLSGVTRRYGDTTALGPVDLDVPTGKTTVLLGPSGCGKSTLLRLINGLITPSEGSVRVLGEAPSPATAEALRRRIGYVIQDGGLFPHLTARDNVTLLPRWLRRPAAQIDARVTELAALARLPLSLLDRHPDALSGGQRQRVALMRALVLNPEVLLLDEPLGALDPMVRAELQRDLREAFRALGKTVVLVTHDLREARHFGDLVVLLRDGRIVQQGTLSELESSPADPFVREFIGAQQESS